MPPCASLRSTPPSPRAMPTGSWRTSMGRRGSRGSLFVVRSFKRWRVPIFAAALILAGAGYIAVSTLAGQGGGTPDPIGQAALSYAGNTMQWDQGPNVQSTHVVPLGELRQALRTYAQPNVAADVNVSALEKQYGTSLRVGLVVLSGTFNTLPPDEGVLAHQAVAVVNAATY